MYSISNVIFRRGGYSNIHLCRDEFGFLYAAKVLRRPRNQTDMSRTTNELKAMKILDRNPNTVRMVDFVNGDTIITEFLRGGTSLEYLSSIEGVAAREQCVSRIVYDILRALVGCHRSGIIHRDIKPENIVMTDPSLVARAVLIDFGLCAFTYGSQGSAQVMSGTPSYMSPDALRLELSTAADIWALGVTTYRLLSDRLPFLISDECPRKLYQEIFHSEADYSASIWDSISPEAIDFIEQCIDKDMQSRACTEYLIHHPWFDSIKKEEPVTSPFYVSSNAHTLTWSSGTDYDPVI